MWEPTTFSLALRRPYNRCARPHRHTLGTELAEMSLYQDRHESETQLGAISALPSSKLHKISHGFFLLVSQSLISYVYEGSQLSKTGWYGMRVSQCTYCFSKLRRLQCSRHFITAVITSWYFHQFACDKCFSSPFLADIETIFLK